MAVIVAPNGCSYDGMILKINDNQVPFIYYKELDDVWMPAKPVMKITGEMNIVQFLDRVHHEDKMSFKDLAEAHGVPEGGCCGFATPPNPQEYNEGKAIWINESGFYQALLGSRKPECKVFQRWVTKCVLPSIRKTGTYSVPQRRSTPAIESARDQLELATLQRQIETERRQTEEQKQIRVIGSLHALEDAGLPVDDRMRLHARDYIASTAFCEQQQQSSTRREICLQQYVRDHKDDVSPSLSSFQQAAIKLGKLCMKHARLQLGDDFVPCKKTIFANGQQVEANCWWEDIHSGIVDAAWKEFITPPKRARRD